MPLRLRARDDLGGEVETEPQLSFPVAVTLRFPDALSPTMLVIADSSAGRSPARSRLNGREVLTLKGRSSAKVMTPVAGSSFSRSLLSFDTSSVPSMPSCCEMSAFCRNSTRKPPEIEVTVTRGKSLRASSAFAMSVVEAFHASGVVFCEPKMRR